MESFLKSVEIRWSDLDPNFHLRHSIYYDLGAVVRLDYLRQYGITIDSLKEEFIGLVIFREECIFRKEILLSDSVSIDVTMTKATRDYSRWSMKHTIFKNVSTLAAVINLDGAWIDINKRKLTKPGEKIVKAIDEMPKDDRFEFI